MVYGIGSRPHRIHSGASRRSRLDISSCTLGRYWPHLNHATPTWEVPKCALLIAQAQPPQTPSHGRLGLPNQSIALKLDVYHPRHTGAT